MNDVCVFSGCSTGSDPEVAYFLGTLDDIFCFDNFFPASFSKRLSLIHALMSTDDR